MTRRVGFLGRRSLVKMLGLSSIGYVATVACTAQKTTTSSTAVTDAPSPTTPVVDVEVRPETAKMTPDQALALLMEGNQRYVEGKSVHPREDPATIRQTASDQFPFAAFLSCADSRVPVERVFDQGVGDCFVTRIAGNVATPELIGSLEFGTEVLGAKVLMVIGHERCGAIVASQGRLDPPLPKEVGSIPTLVPYITPAVQKVEKIKNTPSAKALVDSDGLFSDLEATTKVNVMNQVAKLRQSPILSRLEKEGKLKIVGAYYDLDTGKVTLVDDKVS
ncbi:MAG: carbonic anhydrase [Cyanobacteria bacterium]|nr:carbonic anhydrase [Cyanobacteriota bacterium]MDW8200736.1 carbonic anhydrase [Cyanobacteriota bacterium SKYGB_h_bin112]